MNKRRIDVFSWSFSEAQNEDGSTLSSFPKNLLTLGARFKTDIGILGSLYGFTRSELVDGMKYNPAGLMAGSLKEKLPTEIYILGRLGWQTRMADLVDLQCGIKLMLPISPERDPLFRYPA